MPMNPSLQSILSGDAFGCGGGAGSAVAVMSSPVHRTGLPRPQGSSDRATARSRDDTPDLAQIPDLSGQDGMGL